MTQGALARAQERWGQSGMVTDQDVVEDAYTPARQTRDCEDDLFIWEPGVGSCVMHTFAYDSLGNRVRITIVDSGGVCVDEWTAGAPATPYRDGRVEGGWKGQFSTVAAAVGVCSLRREKGR